MLEFICVTFRTYTEGFQN